MRCPFCNSPLGRQPGAFCAYCGEKLPESMQGAALGKRPLNRNTGSKMQEQAPEEMTVREPEPELDPWEEKPRRESTLGAFLIVIPALALFALIVWALFGDGMDTFIQYLEKVLDMVKQFF